MKKFLLTSALLIALAASAHAEPLLGCFARVYDRQHLAQHPDQLITAVKLKIYPSPLDRTLSFAVQMQRRGEDKPLHNSGSCREEGSKMTCGIDCDGGGVSVTRRSSSTILMGLVGIRMLSCGDTADDENGVYVTSGKDDRDFLLNHVDDAVCRGLEDLK